jgi:hypothetical protein
MSHRSKTNKNHKKRGHKQPKLQNDSRLHDARLPSTWLQQFESPFPTIGQFDNQAWNVIDSFENLAVLTTSTVANTFVNITATFSSLNDYASYAAVFDQYRIMGMKCTLMPASAAALSTTFGHVHTVVDYDDNTSITPAQALDYPNCLVSNLGDTVVRGFKPHVALAAYAGGVFTSFANAEGQWIDCTSSGVVHYGLKVAVNPTSVAVNIDSIVSLWLQFRNPR